MSGEWWYCLRHNEVEGPQGCANTHRMGPYGTREEAALALQSAAERTETWDKDPTWNDDVEESGDADEPERS
jgi:hypothetical protein